ncbi:MAG TPA: EAL domain-containing protein [Gemmatimonadaceae bacterium]|nr:EAL domain-containing protein [Gemmatimonadaceae bacterium]
MRSFLSAIRVWLRTDDHLPRRVERQAASVFFAAAVLLLVYEATKTALLPALTLWESHGVTIAFGSVVAYFASRRALRTQEDLHDRVLRETAERTRVSSEQAAALANERRFRQLVEQSPEAIVLHRPQEVLYANPATLRLLAVTALDGLRDGGLAAWVDAGDRGVLEAQLAALAGGQSLVAPEEYRLHARDGQLRIVEATSVPITLEGETVYQTVLRDVSERKRLERELVHQAFHDGLTGLANRALFHDRVAHALVRSLRSESATRDRCAVIFLDLDDFKSVNDSLGHAAGDAVLATVAKRLLGTTRSCDTVARLGGDEFALLLEDVHAELDAIVTAQRIVQVMRAPVLVGGVQVSIGASVGLAIAMDGDDLDALLRNADLALYTAKSRGKAQYVAFEPAMHAAARDRALLEADLRPALERGEMHVMYQPIVDLIDGRQTGVEALLRWTHPTRGPVPPDVFIPVAEDIGIIGVLGRWVLREACWQLRAWDKAFPSQRLSIGVNVSGRQLEDSRLVSHVREALEASGIPAGRLILEITESVMMRDSAMALERLRALKSLGVQLAIDDFGTGYSSLAYLREFPVDILKIDKSFIDSMSDAGNESVIANAIVSLGESLSLRTVAEGIEDVTQLRRLAELGCQHGQGYLFARPLSANDISSRLKNAERGAEVAG